MNPLRTICLLMGLFALAYAGNGPRPMGMNNNRNSIKNSQKPTDWLSVSQLESLPSLNEVSLKQLEQMSVQEGADLINKLYHLTQVSQDFQPSFVARPSEIPAFLITPDNQKLSFKLNQLPKIAKEQSQFGNQEVTIFITGLPAQTDAIKKANRKLVQAYMQRYNGQAQQPSNQRYQDYDNEQNNPSSSEEDYNNSWKSNSKTPSGNLVVIDLGETIQNYKNHATLDVEQTGAKIGNILVQLTDEANVPQEIIHLVGANMGANVAGAAARQYTRVTGHKLRRITGLDPCKIYAKTGNTLTGLARGDADFVDVIHTSVYGMGTPVRSGDVDFYPNGPNEGVPGADNVVEASMRAIRYFAESVVPGNERNFPAVAASSLMEYKNQNGNGKRVYMGIYTDYDVEGDFILQVNSKSPFGRNTPAQKQQGFHNVHKPWKMSSQNQQ